jgi:hypothetical protein
MNMDAFKKIQNEGGSKTGLSEKFEKLVRTASLVRHFRTVSAKQEKMQGLAGKPQT